jgi:hypothetical protein
MNGALVFKKWLLGFATFVVLFTSCIPVKQTEKSKTASNNAASYLSSDDYKWATLTYGEIEIERSRTYVPGMSGMHGGTPGYTVVGYRVKKNGGKAVELTGKNLMLMLEGYKPAVDLVKKYNAKNTRRKIFRTVGLVLMAGGVAMIAAGSSKASKGTGGGGQLLLGGFGVILAGVPFVVATNKSYEKNVEKYLIEAARAYNARNDK